MENICIHMNGQKCAESFCDYWDLEERKCALALESINNAKIKRIVLEQMEKTIEVQEYRDIMKEYLKKYPFKTVSTIRH